MAGITYKPMGLKVQAPKRPSTPLPSWGKEWSPTDYTPGGDTPMPGRIGIGRPLPPPAAPAPMPNPMQNRIQIGYNPAPPPALPMAGGVGYNPAPTLPPDSYQPVIPPQPTPLPPAMPLPPTIPPPGELQQPSPVMPPPAPVPAPVNPRPQETLQERTMRLRDRRKGDLGDPANLRTRIDELQTRRGEGDLYPKNYTPPNPPTTDIPPPKPPSTPNDKPPPLGAAGIGGSMDRKGSEWRPSEMAEWAPPPGFNTFFGDVGEYEGTEGRRAELKKEKNQTNKKIKAQNKTVNQRKLRKIKRLRDKKKADKKAAKGEDEGAEEIKYTPQGGAASASVKGASSGGIVAGEQPKKDKGEPINIGDVLTKGEREQRKLTRLQKKKAKLKKKIGNLESPRKRPQPGTPKRPYRSRGQTNTPGGFGGKLRI
jgi:hypothetical protein